METLSNVKALVQRRSGLFPALVYFAALLFWVWIFFNAPYMDDDWFWGTQVGMKAFLTGNTNSRYAGNLVIILLTRSRLFKTLFCGIVAWLLPWSLSRMTSELDENNKLILFCFANLSIFLARIQVWEETFGWLASFANYNTSALCMVWIYTAIKRSFAQPESSTGKKLKLFILTFVSMLFVENLSIYFFGIAFVGLLLAVYLKRNRGNMIAMFAAAVCGALLMFTGSGNTALYESGKVGVREITISGKSFPEMLRIIAESIHFHLPYTYEINGFLCLTVLLAATAMLWLCLENKKLKLVLSAGNFLLAALEIAYMLELSFPEFFMTAEGNTYISQLLILYVSIEMLLLVVLGKDKIFLLNQCFLWLSTFLVILPLTVTRHSGDRLLLASIVLAAMFGAETWAYMASRNLVGKKTDLCVRWLSLAVCLVFMLYTANVYRVIGRIDRQHVQIINESKLSGAEEIKLPEYMPLHCKYLYNWNSSGDAFYDKYMKRFNEIPQEVKVEYYSLID